MSDVEDLLDARLMHLGALERKLETLIKELRAEVSQAVHTGQLDRADKLCNTVEELAKELVPLQSEIMTVELKLYGLRRR